MANRSFHTIGTIRDFVTVTVPPGSIEPHPAPPMLDVLCPADRPLALLPVRLETRFFTQADGSQELRIRVYPDKIHLDSHETELTRTEHQWACHYWEQDWRAGNDRVARQRAWRQMADRFGAERAGWVVHQVAPANPAERPTAPLPDGEALTPGPAFPAVEVVQDNEDAWRSAPCARLLPVRWIAVLHAAGRPVLVERGRDIVQPLAVGPDPKLAVPEDGERLQDGSELDPGMRWMVDFDAAEAAGMGLRMKVPATMLPDGLDLFVLGVGAASEPAEAAQTAVRLADLLDAQHRTDGLSVLPLGTPTNNSEDRRAGYDSGDPGRQRSYTVEIEGADGVLGSASNAALLGSAFGLAPTRVVQTLARIEGGRESHEADQRAINTALWPVGWGYFLANVIGFDGTGLTAALRDLAREHFIDYVRAAGPFPVLRCGRQPYGVLPVTSLDNWQANGSDDTEQQAFETALRALLLALRDRVWRPRLHEAPRLGMRSPPDPDADLADVMRSEGQSTAWRARAVFGPHYFQHLRAFIGEDLRGSGFLSALDAAAAALPQRLGFAWRARLASAVFAEAARRVTAPRVQAGDVSPWHPLAPDFIGALLAETSIDGLIAQRPGPEDATAPASLLQSLLRHALLREIAEAVARIAARQPGADFGALLRDAELFNLPVEAEPTPSWRLQLDLSVPEVTGGQTVRQFIEGQTRFDSPELHALGELRTALAHLQQLDSEALHWLMQGTLDLAAHRLDAWITSLATRRLRGMRAASPEGLYVGAYGWVEGLAPAASRVEVERPAGEAAPLFAHTNDSGFIHAPSMTHASAAALLRNAHLGASGQPAADSPFAIDLSSHRAREAERLLAGVRSGQPLGALLGYRVERSLHELGHDRFIAPLRELAPLLARKLEQTDLAVEAIAAQNVVDGLVLHRRWKDERERVTGTLTAAGAGPQELATLQRELDALGEAIDGLSDALTAEAAYQMARGNTGRLAGTLAAISQGDAPAPELEVARMPRSGTAITHRVLLLWGTKPSAGTGWGAASKSPRAATEPILNAWAAQLLGDPRKVRCTVEALNIAGAQATMQSFRLSELSTAGLAPLDAVYGVEAGKTSGSGGGVHPQAGTGGSSEIEQLVLNHARHRDAGFGEAATLRLVQERPADLAADEQTLEDLLEQARAVRALLVAARGAEPADLSPPQAGDSGTLDLEELEGRVVKAEKALVSAVKKLSTKLKAGEHTPPAELCRASLALVKFGIGPVVPSDGAAAQTATGWETALRAQAAAQMREATQRLEQSAELRSQPPTDDPRDRHGRLVERLRAVFGSDFVVLPRFRCDAAASRDLAEAFAANEQVQGGDPFAVHAWFRRYSRVREPLARLSACLRGSEVLGSRERLRLQVAQLPHSEGAEGQRWVALPPPAGQRLPEGKLSLVVQARAAIDTEAPLVGLWVDEWVEVVPHREETSAIAFQFNPPDACAPQNVLLAVPPVPGEAWTLASLHRVLIETLDLAKLRAIDSESLGDAAQYLPALMLAFNAKDDAVSTDFAPLIR